MSEEHTISAVSTQTRDYGDGAKAKRVYYVKLEGVVPKVGVQAFELHKLQTSKPPAVGHKLDVKMFQEGEFSGTPFVKIIQEYKADAPRQQSGGRDDATGQSIERQVAAKCAAEMAAAAGGDAPTMVANFEAVFDIVIGKIQAAPQQQLPVATAEVPAETDGLVPAATTADGDDIPF